MALIGALPDEAYVTSMSWELEYPGQSVLRSPGNVQVLNRSSGRWVGQIDIGIMKNDAEGRKVAAFLDRLRGSANEFTVPLTTDIVTQGFPGAVFRVVAVGVDRALAGGGIINWVMPFGSGWQNGSMLSIAGRAYRLSGSLGGSALGTGLYLYPQRRLPVGSVVTWQDPTMTVRLSEPPTVSFQTPDFLGPWTLRVEEAV